ncbi:MAG TPA: TatD family hydrolase [Rhabdochlamydiaceae bacterium]
MLIDTHAHLTSEQVEGQLDGMLVRAKEKGVGKILNICTDVASLEKGLTLAQREPWLFNAAATTPHDVEKEGEHFFPFVEDSAKKGELAAIGETGLDYHYTHSPKKLQQDFLIRYFELAKSCHLPLIIHCRDAFEDLLAMIDQYYADRPGVLHCFTGTLQEAKQLVNRGWLISFSGIITFKKSESLREVAAWAPLDRIVIETDTPYLAPQGHRGKVNEPSFIIETAQEIARLKGIPLEKVAQITADNACKLFLKMR